MIKQLSHISISTKNIKYVIKFYVKILGFKISHNLLIKKIKNYTVYLSIAEIGPL